MLAPSVDTRTRTRRSVELVALPMIHTRPAMASRILLMPESVLAVQAAGASRAGALVGAGAAREAPLSPRPGAQAPSTRLATASTGHAATVDLRRHIVVPPGESPRRRAPRRRRTRGTVR